MYVEIAVENYTYHQCKMTTILLLNKKRNYKNKKMAKRKQDKIKNFRGKRRAAQDATEDWMLGNVGSIVATSTGNGEPPFQIEAAKHNPPTRKGIATLLKGDQTIRIRRSTSKGITTEVEPTRATNSLLTPPKAGSLPMEDDSVDAESDTDHVEEVDVDVYQVPDDDNEMDEEEGEQVQIVTPRGKTSDKPTMGDAEAEVILTVEQYQSIIRDYKERLVMAERQVRAISKTSLADRFMENEVRKYVKESLWKRCKFITCTETMSDCMNEVAAQFAIVAEKREHWKSTYAHAVRDALNNRRNNSSQDLKKELTGTYVVDAVPWHDGPFTHPLLVPTALRKECPGMYASPKVFYNVRACTVEENFEPFWIFFDRLVATIAGKKIWTNRDKVGVPITTGGKITIVDEAFTVLAIENYWPKWFSPNGVPSPAKWTDSRQGNSQYMGWHEDAYTRFDQICYRIKQQRASVQSKHLELNFQQNATIEYATRRGGIRARVQRQEPSIVVFNELANDSNTAV